jgi:hypothetical protein
MELLFGSYSTESDEDDDRRAGPLTAEEDGVASDGDGDASSGLTLTAINPVEKVQLTSRAWLDRIDAMLPAVGSAAEVGAVTRTPIVRGDSSIDGFVLDEVLTPDECAALIALTEDVPSADGGYTFWNKSDPQRAFRNADTIEVHHAALAALLWRRIRSAMTEDELALDLSAEEGTARQHMRWQRDLDGQWMAVGSNEHVLFGRYHAGGHFAPHTDGYSIVDFNHRSMYSIVLFLATLETSASERADGRHNGGTRFYSDAMRGKDALVRDVEGRWTGAKEHLLGTVEAKVGRAVVFFHNHMHEGLPPHIGSTKYIIRSDLMYRRVPPVATAPEDSKAFALYCEANALTEADLPPGARSVEAEALKMLQRCFRMSPALAEIYGM